MHMGGLKCAFASACLSILISATATADITPVMYPPNTVSSGSFSAFAYNPALDEIVTGGYLSGWDLRWSEIVDDSTEPWEINGGQSLSNFQLEIFARDGYAGNRSSYNLWGMDYIPLDDSFMLLGIASLRGPSGTARLDAERELVKHYPGLPDSPQVMPTNVTVSNAGGVYALTDNNLGAGDGFISAGVHAGHRLTLYPVDFFAEIYAETYTITSVVSETEVRLDKNPIFGSASVQTGVGYLLSVQPHVTLYTFRQNIPYFASALSTGPKANYKGGLSPDGSTLYVAEQVSDNMLAVDTQTPETFSIFISTATIQQYVADQIAAGRHLAVVNPKRVFRDSLAAPWNDASTGVTADYSSEEAFFEGDESLKVTFDAAGGELVLESDDAEAPDPIGYEAIHFWIHGGTTGGQAIELAMFNSNGIGSGVTLNPPAAGTWSEVVIPLSSFTVVDDIFTIKFTNLAAGAQDAFYLDKIEFDWTDPLPAWAGAYVVEDAGIGNAQTHVDSLGRVWFVEGETDDILWTTDGVTLHTFLTSKEIAEAEIAAGVIDPNSSEASNFVQAMGFIVDDMFNVYWGNNTTNSIWKAPASNPAAGIKELAPAAELMESLSLPRNPRGMQCFTLRNMQLLTFNFVDGNMLYAVDLETGDYGDYDGDFDADAEDFAMFFDACMSGPGVDTPPASCTADEFALADLDDDGDVDAYDYAKFQQYASPVTLP